MAWNSWQLSVGVTSIVTLVASQPVWAAPIAVTTVELYDTDTGLELVLKTANQTSLVTKTSTEGKTVIITISNVKLQLPKGTSFGEKNPTPDIEEILVVQSDPNTIEIEVTGVKTPPKTAIRQKGQEFSLDIFSATSTPAPTPGTSTPTPAPGATSQTQTPAPATNNQTPSPETTSQAPAPGTTPQTPAAETQPPAEDEPIELTVVGEQVRPSYQVPNSSIGTRTDTPIINVPQAIQVIPQEIIKDQGTRSLGEVFKNTSSANTGRSSSQAPVLNPVIRGFESTNILRNGLRDESLRYSSEVSNVERVELLKGPASVLFGRGDLGGVVNLVTKQPLDDPFYSGEYQVGQFGLNRVSLDLSGPLGKNGVAYRLNSAYQSADSFKKFENSNSFFISPVVRLINTKDTTLTADIEYLKYRSFGTAPDLPASGTVLPNPNGKVALNSNLGEPSLSQSETISTRLGYQLSHRFSPNWSIRNEFIASFLDIPENNGVTPIANSGRADGLSLSPAPQRQPTQIRRFLVENPTNVSNIGINTNLSGKFKTGSIEHDLLLGVEVSRERSKDQINFRQLANIDIFNPVYRPRSLASFAIPFADSDITKNNIGLYAQNQISLSKNIILVLGGRLDFSEQKYEDLLNSEESFERNDTVFSPRVGVVIKPSEDLSFYASYTRSFTPVVGRTRVLLDPETGESEIGEPFKPERGTQYEVGVKANLFNDRVSTTLSFYDLERTNVAAQGLSEPLSRLQIGKQRSRGIELDIAGEITPGWNLAASYAYTDTEILDDTRANFNGKQLQNVPRNAFGLWTTYELQSGSLKGLGVGIGFFNQGERQGNLINSFTLPGYWRTDASLFYRRENFRAALNVQNLFDKQYFEGARDLVRIVPGAPLTISGTISFEF